MHYNNAQYLFSDKLRHFSVGNETDCYVKWEGFNE